MKLKFVFAFCLLVGVAFVSGDDTDADNKKTTLKPTTTSTLPPSTTGTPSTTATPSTTSVPPTTPTTPTPTTNATTVTPSTPTPSPVTTPSTSTLAPSTTHAPSPPEQWMVNDTTTGIVCILAEMEVNFKMHSGKDVVSKTLTPAGSTASGDCSPASQWIKISWPSGGNTTSFMKMSFLKKGDNYFVSKLDLSLAHNVSSDEFVSSTFSSVNLTLFETSINSSYACGSLNLNELKNAKNETVTIALKGISVEAFRTQKTTKFSSGHYCSPEIPDIVPLVVGIALAALVLVVVIAYLIGRRRSQARGYLSM